MKSTFLRSGFIRRCQYTRYPIRNLSQQYSKDGGFFSSFINNIKEEFSKNKEIKANIKKFRDEAGKLEQSEALKEARRKYKSLEQDTLVGGQFVRAKVDELSEKALNSDLAKQALKLSSQVSSTVKTTAGTISKAGAELSKTDAARAFSSTMHEIREQLDDVTAFSKRTQMYQQPVMLRKRSELAAETCRFTQPIKNDTQTTNVVLHKDWSWYDSWQNFKDNNSYMNKVFEFKSKYDESDNTVIRATKFITATISDKISSMFLSKTDLSEALNEIHKVDSDFNLYNFMKQVELEIAPNVFGALSSNRLDILRDWCHEAVFNVLSHELKQAESAGNKYMFRIFDIGEVEFAAGKLMEQGPIVVVTFNTQQISYVTDMNGNVHQGSKDKLKSVMNVWALCRDQTISDSHACWRLIDMSVQERCEIVM
ncbi:hypothetical protein GJ496_010106 [Pomphorhynchus laevis]|nr:hypothetical protein GJ496_010106 [Pomphorhynchus laevis]